MLCDDVGWDGKQVGRGGPRGGDTCIHIADSLRCTARLTQDCKANLCSTKYNYNKLTKLLLLIIKKSIDRICSWMGHLAIRKRWEERLQPGLGLSSRINADTIAKQRRWVGAGREEIESSFDVKSGDQQSSWAGC